MYPPATCVCKSKDNHVCVIGTMENPLSRPMMVVALTSRDFGPGKISHPVEGEVTVSCFAKN